VSTLDAGQYGPYDLTQEQVGVHIKDHDLTTAYSLTSQQIAIRVLATPLCSGGNTITSSIANPGTKFVTDAGTAWTAGYRWSEFTQTKPIPDCYPHYRAVADCTNKLHAPDFWTQQEAVYPWYDNSAIL